MNPFRAKRGLVLVLSEDEQLLLLDLLEQGLQLDQPLSRREKLARAIKLPIANWWQRVFDGFTTWLKGRYGA